MPFGYSSKLFPHPAVEYIPLLPIESYSIDGERKSKDRSYPLAWVDKPNLLVFTGVHAKDAEPFLCQLNEFSLDPDVELGIVLINSQLETIKYRGNYVTIVATPLPGQDQVVKILTKYFYKPDLVFELVNPLTENVACQRKLKRF